MSAHSQFRCARSCPLASSARRNLAPRPRRGRRHRRAQSRAEPRAVDREREGPRSKAPPKLDDRSPAWQRGTSRSLRQSSANRQEARAAPRRGDAARASSSRARPAPSRFLRVQRMCAECQADPTVGVSSSPASIALCIAARNASSIFSS